jgi:ABC-type multidrug transport system fused ATPase/permease subunit
VPAIILAAAAGAALLFTAANALRMWRNADVLAHRLDRRMQWDQRIARVQELIMQDTPSRSGSAGAAAPRGSEDEGDIPVRFVPLYGLQHNVRPVTVSFHKLRLTLPHGRCIVNSVSGVFRSGTISAVFGASGAGKTSLLNALLGKTFGGKLEGQVLFNGVPVDPRAARHHIGYVPQDDILHADLTVRENLYYSASLRLPRSVSHTRRSLIVSDVIRILGLERVQNQLVGDVETRSLSGTCCLPSVCS